MLLARVPSKLPMPVEPVDVLPVDGRVFVAVAVAVPVGVDVAGGGVGGVLSVLVAEAGKVVMMEEATCWVTVAAT
jgi:hypothetical protein